MRNPTVLLIVILAVMLAMGARAGEAVAVASVDLNRIQNDVGSHRLIWLDLGEEARGEVLKLRRILDQIVVASLKEEDDSNLAVLQARIQSINNKLNILRSALGNRNCDYRKILTKYITRRYGETYAFIYDAQMARNNWPMIIWSASSTPDLTEEIIQTLDRELP